MMMNRIAISHVRDGLIKVEYQVLVLLADKTQAIPGSVNMYVNRRVTTA